MGLQNCCSLEKSNTSQNGVLIARSPAPAMSSPGAADELDRLKEPTHALLCFDQGKLSAARVLLQAMSTPLELEAAGPLLHSAVRAGDAEACAFILQNCPAAARATDSSSKGGTALHTLALACPTGGHAVCRVLLQAGVDESCRDAEGHLAADLAQDRQVFKLLEIRRVNTAMREASLLPKHDVNEKDNQFLRRFRQERSKFKMEAQSAL
eukprot:TRINITY_DN51607_c0_g1_i1.p1 TRINITY_DN51607_c0_g1~~TRINITY_DN51607_c0_g1_i1.p1  ORF type:complete len:220 (-),score=47.57 TRINITY_DN51607_c0_g1_i1:152-781(-)